MAIDEDTAASVNNLFKEVQTKLQLHVQDLTKLADKISDKIDEVATATVKAVDTVAPVVEAAVPVAAPEVGIAKEVLDGISEEIQKLHAKFDALTGKTDTNVVEVAPPANSEAEVAALSEPVEPTSAPSHSTAASDTSDITTASPTVSSDGGTAS
jgi:hypothetical protein